jgi:hypothetical protein
MARAALSLDTLLGQLNALAPGRNKASDGWIGDADHQNRTSDHNPWYPPPNGGIVTARDFTHDPRAGGLDCQWLADTLIANRDPRIKYVIWNRRIWQGSWRAYSGANPHTAHLHLSVVASPANDSTTSWAGIGPAAPPPEDDVELTEPMRPFIWPHTADVKDTVGSTLANTQSYAKTILDRLDRVDARLAAIEARPVADVDEVALAAELEARGIGGVTAAELKDILSTVRLTT